MLKYKFAIFLGIFYAVVITDAVKSVEVKHSSQHKTNTTSNQNNEVVEEVYEKTIEVDLEVVEEVDVEIISKLGQEDEQVNKTLVANQSGPSKSKFVNENRAKISGEKSTPSSEDIKSTLVLQTSRALSNTTNLKLNLSNVSGNKTGTGSTPSFSVVSNVRPTPIFEGNRSTIAQINITDIEALEVTADMAMFDTPKSTIAPPDHKNFESTSVSSIVTNNTIISKSTSTNPSTRNTESISILSSNASSSSNATTEVSIPRANDTLNSGSTTQNLTSQNIEATISVHNIVGTGTAKTTPEALRPEIIEIIYTGTFPSNPTSANTESTSISPKIVGLGTAQITTEVSMPEVNDTTNPGSTTQDLTSESTESTISTYSIVGIGAAEVYNKHRSEKHQRHKILVENSQDQIDDDIEKIVIKEVKKQLNEIGKEIGEEGDEEIIEVDLEVVKKKYEEVIEVNVDVVEEKYEEYEEYDLYGKYEQVNKTLFAKQSGEQKSISVSSNISSIRTTETTTEVSTRGADDTTDPGNTAQNLTLAATTDESINGTVDTINTESPTSILTSENSESTSILPIIIRLGTVKTTTEVPIPGAVNTTNPGSTTQNLTSENTESTIYIGIETVETTMYPSTPERVDKINSGNTTINPSSGNTESTSISSTIANLGTAETTTKVSTSENTESTIYTGTETVETTTYSSTPETVDTINPGSTKTNLISESTSISPTTSNLGTAETTTKVSTSENTESTIYTGTETVEITTYSSTPETVDTINPGSTITNLISESTSISPSTSNLGTAETTTKVSTSENTESTIYTDTETVETTTYSSTPETVDTINPGSTKTNLISESTSISPTASNLGAAETTTKVSMPEAVNVTNPGRSTQDLTSVNTESILPTISTTANLSSSNTDSAFAAFNNMSTPRTATPIPIAQNNETRSAALTNTNTEVTTTSETTDTTNSGSNTTTLSPENSGSTLTPELPNITVSRSSTTTTGSEEMVTIPHGLLDLIIRLYFRNKYSLIINTEIKKKITRGSSGSQDFFTSTGSEKIVTISRALLDLIIHLYFRNEYSLTINTEIKEKIIRESRGTLDFVTTTGSEEMVTIRRGLLDLIIRLYFRNEYSLVIDTEIKKKITRESSGPQDFVTARESEEMVTIPRGLLDLVIRLYFRKEYSLVINTEMNKKITRESSGSQHFVTTTGSEEMVKIPRGLFDLIIRLYFRSEYSLVINTEIDRKITRESSDSQDFVTTTESEEMVTIPRALLDLVIRLYFHKEHSLVINTKIKKKITRGSSGSQDFVTATGSEEIVTIPRGLLDLIIRLYFRSEYSLVINTEIKETITRESRGSQDFVTTTGSEEMVRIPRGLLDLIIRLYFRSEHSLVINTETKEKITGESRGSQDFVILDDSHAHVGEAAIAQLQKVACLYKLTPVEIKSK